MEVVPITIRYAKEFVNKYHRHNKAPVGAKFAIGCLFNDEIVGVAIVGRPIARKLDNQFTAEVVRLCTKINSPKNVCSFLYAKCWRIWQQMGGKKMITYTLEKENGHSLKAVGWKILGQTKPFKNGTGWTTRKNRVYQPLVPSESKNRWEISCK